jgi:hypothetical protein
VPITPVISIGLCLLWLVAPAAAAATTPEVTAKPPPRAPGQATIYFLRPKGLGGFGMLSPDVLIDGRKVGELSAGTFFVVSRPPGHHTIETHGGILHTSRQSEVDFAAGQTYFFEIGPQESGLLANDLLAMVLTNTRGREVPGHGLFNYVFYSLDAEQGRAEIAKLKK